MVGVFLIDTSNLANCTTCMTDDETTNYPRGVSVKAIVRSSYLRPKKKKNRKNSVPRGGH